MLVVPCAPFEGAAWPVPANGKVFARALLSQLMNASQPSASRLAGGTAVSNSISTQPWLLPQARIALFGCKRSAYAHLLSLGGLQSSLPGPLHCTLGPWLARAASWPCNRSTSAIGPAAARGHPGPTTCSTPVAGAPFRGTRSTWAPQLS